MAPARVILLIAPTIAKNWTHLLVSALIPLHNYFFDTIVTNFLPKKKHFI